MNVTATLVFRLNFVKDINFVIQYFFYLLKYFLCKLNWLYRSYTHEHFCRCRDGGTRDIEWGASNVNSHTLAETETKSLSLKWCYFQVDFTLYLNYSIHSTKLLFQIFIPSAGTEMFLVPPLENARHNQSPVSQVTEFTQVDFDPK